MTLSRETAVREAEQQIRRQRGQLSNLREGGRDTTLAEKSLAEMEAALPVLQTDGPVPWPHQAFVQNRLLRALPKVDFDLLAPAMERVSLAVRQVLIEPNIPIERLYFIEEGLVSAVGSTKNGWLEFGIIGNDGVVGVPVAMGVDRTPHQLFVQISGEAWSVPAEALREAIERTMLRQILLRYAHVFQLQTIETALANGSQTVERRLARWLLLYDDRVPGQEFHITHDFLARMLGVRRASVTVAIHVLEGEHLIRAKRQSITIRDRGRLEELAADCYGLAEREFVRLIP